MQHGGNDKIHKNSFCLMKCFRCFAVTELSNCLILTLSQLGLPTAFFPSPLLSMRLSYFSLPTFFWQAIYSFFLLQREEIENE